MDVVNVEDLSFSYNRDILLDNLDLDIKKGEFISIIGANGSGKSTLLKLLLGEIQPSSGKIKIFGEYVSNFKDWTKVGYVNQSGLSHQLSFPASAKEIVCSNLYSDIGLFKRPKKIHYEKSLEALKLVDMKDYASVLLKNMSGGQRQRILLARALVNNPKFMILDEPTSAIDEKNTISFYELLTKLNREREITILMITHDNRRVSKYATKTFLLSGGKLKLET